MSIQLQAWTPQARAPSGPSYNVDWIVSNTSNVHVATHRDWFTNFTAFPSTLGLFFSSSGGGKVLGVGDVALEVRKVTGEAARKKRGRKTSTIILRDVVYAPSYPTNIVGLPMFEEYGVMLGPGESGVLTNISTRATEGLLDLARLPKLLLKGQAWGQTSLDPDGRYAINATWSEKEQCRWLAFKSSSAVAASHAVTAAGGGQPPYTAEETRWLKHKYGGEFRFLRQLGLRIHSEEHREEGRAIARAFMADSDIERNGQNEGYDDFLSNASFVSRTSQTLPVFPR
ncbi:hypothetical protein LTR85_010349 [Meristemomyces frigidus]|nr:hypothetical protein LTR85_010349 [Meristemomyces frigidus]